MHSSLFVQLMRTNYYKIVKLLKSFKIIIVAPTSNLITVQQDAAYSVYYISVGSSTCFGC